MNKYMHLLNGQPAEFADGLICFARQGAPLSSLLVSDLKTIKRQQQVTEEYRRRNGLSDWEFEYGYLRVKADI
jgi:hypothetical protein